MWKQYVNKIYGKRLFNLPYNYSKNIIWLELFLAQVKKEKNLIFYKFTFFSNQPFITGKKLKKNILSKSNKCLPYFFFFYMHLLCMSNLVLAWYKSLWSLQLKLIIKSIRRRNKIMIQWKPKIWGILKYKKNNLKRLKRMKLFTNIKLN